MKKDCLYVKHCFYGFFVQNVACENRNLRNHFQLQKHTFFIVSLSKNTSTDTVFNDFNSNCVFNCENPENINLNKPHKYLIVSKKKKHIN